MITIEPAQSKEDFTAIAGMAKIVWQEHYHPILGEDQVAYMIEKFQSPYAITHQVSDQGYLYYFLRDNGQNAGYLAIQPEKYSLFLSKLYIQKTYRHQGIARSALNFLTDYCREHRLSKIWLTVNRHNHDSIAVYTHLGFVIAREQKADIGNGYVMDDYIMELAV